MDANVEFIEAVHLAGASSVLYPVWNGFDQGGLSTLASLVFMIKFYSELPIHSQKRDSILHAARNTQLWMREQTASQVIAWLSKCPLPEKERLEMIRELEIYVDVSGPSRSDKQQLHEVVDVNQTRDPVRPGDRKFFSHWLQWGAFCVSGHGGGVHPKNLTEEDEDVENDHLIHDETLNNIDLEILLLKREGRYEEASLLEARRRELGYEAMMEKVAKAKQMTILAARAMQDTFDALDKALLDQDDDEVEVGESEADELERMRKKEAHKLEMDRYKGAAVKTEREIDEERQRKEEEKADKKARKEAEALHAKKRAGGGIYGEVGPLRPGGGSVFLRKLAETNPQIAKLTKQETPVSKFRGYIESLFPTEDDDYEYDSEAAPGSPLQKRLKPKKFVPIEPGSEKMKALERRQQSSGKIFPQNESDEGAAEQQPGEGGEDDFGADDEKDENGDLYYADHINERNLDDFEKKAGRGERQRRFRREKTQEELEAEERALERKNERAFAMKGSSANLLDLLPNGKDGNCTLS
jgi:hypothetical protein